MDFAVAVRSLSFGDDGPAPAPVELSWTTQTVSVKDLITAAVAAQVARDTPAPVGDDRGYLTPAEVDTLAASGRIRPTAAVSDRAPVLETEVERALSGFRDGRFFITVNGHQPQALDEMILLTDHTDVTFVRLMPLVGG